MNTKNQHTPGPWISTPLYVKGTIKGWGINGVNDSGDTLTSGRIVDVMSLVPNHDMPTQEANTRLIAAAPELLGQLVNLVQLVEEREQGNDDLKDDLAKCNAAIAKAIRAK